MKLRLFSSRPEAYDKWWHFLAKILIFSATLLAVALGIAVAEYDDAPGAVIIFPAVMYLGCVIVYSIILRISFGRRRKS